MKHAFCLFIVCIFCAGLTAQDAETTLTIRNDKAKKGTSTITGTLLQWNRQGIALQMTGRSSPRQLALEDVLTVDYPRTSEEQAADHHFQQKAYADALEIYRREFTLAESSWKQVLLLEKMVRCHVALGQYAQAIEFFLDMASREPELTDERFASIPLAWRATLAETAGETAAERLSQQNRRPEAVLLCASWLLSSAHREDATLRLKALSTHADPRIAALATAQIWRLEWMTGTPEKLATWKTALSSIPEPLRGGAFFVLGQGYAKQERHDDAAIAFLKCALAYPYDPKLTAEALRLAGDELEKGGHPEEKAALKLPE